MELEELILQADAFHLDLQELQEEVSLLKFEKEELERRILNLEAIIPQLKNLL